MRSTVLSAALVAALFAGPALAGESRCDHDRDHIANAAAGVGRAISQGKSSQEIDHKIDALNHAISDAAKQGCLSCQ